MAKITITCTEKELELINKTLDFYTRVGIGQFKEIIEHPTFEKNLSRLSISDKNPEIGDKTPEWKELKGVKLNPDYERLKFLQKEASYFLHTARTILYGERLGENGSWGIFHPNVDDSCKVAFHLHQIIRNTFWKARKDKSNNTVDPFPVNTCQIANIEVPTFEITIEDEDEDEDV